MTDPERRPTIGRQMLVGYALSFAITLVLLVMAVAVLARVADAKDSVLHRDARLVVDAYRLDLALETRSGAARSFLLTGDEAYARVVEESGREFTGTLADLRSNARRDSTRRLLAEIDRTEDGWDAAIRSAMVRARGGTVPLAQVAEVINTDLAPARRELSSLVDQLVDEEERLIEEATRASDDTARWAMVGMVLLGLLGLAAAVAVGARITFTANRQLSGLALRVDAAAAEILAATSQHVAGASEQAASVQETVATADELAQTADQSAGWARTVADRARRSAGTAGDGTAAVADAGATMAAIGEQVTRTTGAVVTLSERARAISGIVTAVEDIADQTHLLALNAAIEAARAGEHGRGFSVVAGEIRALADQSRRATAQVSEILQEIDAGMQAAVLATEQSNRSVGEGARRIDDAGTTIAQLAEMVEGAAIAAEQIAASAGQQAVATTQISQAMRDLDEVTQQNVTAARQSEEAARDLSLVALHLKALVGAG